MQSQIFIGDLQDDRCEMAERKGIGHPDTLCDEIVEQISHALANYYREHFGVILHYNIDKALLIGGQSIPKFGGGTLLKPIKLIIAGRATQQFDGKNIPIEEIAIETAKAWLKSHLRYLDVDRHIEIQALIRTGSTDLKSVFPHFHYGEVPLANDTSFGAGYFPLTSLEYTIQEIDQSIHQASFQKKHPYAGEDTKVMGIQLEAFQQFTIAFAMVDRYLLNLDAYIQAKTSIHQDLLNRFSGSNLQLAINTADNYDQQSIYYTVTGTSAENGDDGQVGRGNRLNGLITPYHPMSLEAWAGKNPVSHIGKIYNHFALELSKALVVNRMCSHAQTFLVTQIGHPIDQPQLLHLRLKNRQVSDDHLVDFTHEYLRQLPNFWQRFLSN